MQDRALCAFIRRSRYIYASIRFCGEEVLQRWYWAILVEFSVADSEECMQGLIERLDFVTFKLTLAGRASSVPPLIDYKKFVRGGGGGHCCVREFDLVRDT